MVDFAVANEARDTLKKYWGFDQFRKGQQSVIYGVLKGRDTLVVMPTGGGKSACYQIPAVIMSGVTLVISPLIALMKDQVDDLNNRGISATFINSSIDPEEQRRRMDGAFSGEYKLLYIAPERFKNPVFASQVRTLPVNLLAVWPSPSRWMWWPSWQP